MVTYKRNIMKGIPIQILRPMKEFLTFMIINPIPATHQVEERVKTVGHRKRNELKKDFGISTNK